MYKPGEKVPISGVYEIIPFAGTASGTPHTIALDKESIFPPTPQAGFVYRLKHEVVSVYTTTSSTVSMGGTSVLYNDVLNRLAKK